MAKFNCHESSGIQVSAQINKTAIGSQFEAKIIARLESIIRTSRRREVEDREQEIEAVHASLPQVLVMTGSDDGKLVLWDPLEMRPLWGIEYDYKPGVSLSRPSFFVNHVYIIFKAELEDMILIEGAKTFVTRSKRYCLDFPLNSVVSFADLLKAVSLYLIWIKVRYCIPKCMHISTDSALLEEI